MVKATKLTVKNFQVAYFENPLVNEWSREA